MSVPLRGYTPDYKVGLTPLKLAEVMATLSQEGDKTLHVFLIEWAEGYEFYYFVDGRDAQEFENCFRCDFQYWEGR